jgi:glycosyltransferase involved in cell wall biosynthesis
MTNFAMNIAMNIAVIIPVKNRAEWIEACVASVQSQSLRVDEIVIVDDGSHDQTPSILLELASLDPRIRIKRFEASIGAAAASNAGIAMTTAEWVCFLDSDDRWASEKLARQAAKLSGTTDAIASFTGYNIISAGSEFPVKSPKYVALNDLRHGNIVGTTSSAMVNRAALIKVGGFNPALPSCQDWDLWLRLRKIGNFAMVPECLVDFIQYSNARILLNRDAVLRGHQIMLGSSLDDVPSWIARRKIRASHKIRLSQDYGSDLVDIWRRLYFSAAAMIAWPVHRSRESFKGACQSLWNNSHDR